MPPSNASSTTMSIPPVERKRFLDTANVQLGHFDPSTVVGFYKSLGFTVIENPFDEAIIAPIQQALVTKSPYSAVRIGDGEASILAHRCYDGTPNLDDLALLRSIDSQLHTFTPNAAWKTALQQMMLHAMESADMLGVLGLWRPNAANQVTRDMIEAHFSKDPRGLSGHWRGIDLPMRFAERGHFRGALISSAHLYFSVAQRLDELIPVAESVICITDKTKAVEALQRKHPSANISPIHLRLENPPATSASETPSFLDDVSASLPRHLTGTLCLVGAGVWAEYYCTWIKQRGGVAIDIGSGFDLIQGEVSRPIHRRLDKSIVSGFDLTKGQ